ncbi:hypothetical protein STZ1_40379 [Bacillus subtilis]
MLTFAWGVSIQTSYVMIEINGFIVKKLNTNRVNSLFLLPVLLCKS